ncbi:ABC transporter substrate-binding protein [Truepera radiovictrix]|uniref:Extracellular solute-binding protein family 1 n=1 Tax=Truepera radiovictrix (strain DSM 17093 / CIP 108686 / LMG 22925 / RQ-24) TaxID=649638 RepID=D7CRC8_TRURR|nr:extracellular solute-binding protein [Truepera radiovictrix]ADI15216.1 extracellular solute-binding protein family 1 [Truepera radiovictrix DSM 17093]WMT56233.1 extracellular solute-binding protein [Truepera radiovictrix]
MKKLVALALTSTLGLAAAQTQISIGLFEPLNEHVERVLPRFQEEHPDIEVEIRTLGFNDHHNALVTALATGSGAADVVAVEIGYIARFVAEGGLVDLSEEPFSADQYENLFVSYAWQQARTPDGRQIAMPTDIAPGVMYYRRDHLEAAGANVDEIISSWDSYLEYGRQVRELGDVYLIADAASVANAIIRSDIPEGEGIFFDAEGNPLLNSERFVQAATIAQQIRQEGLDAQIGAWSNEWYEAFRRGTVATELSGAWLGGHLQTWMAPDTAGLWGASEMPGGVLVSWGGSFYGIPTQSQNQEAAWELIKFLTTDPEIQLEAFRTINAFPAMPETYGDPMFEEPLDFLAGQPARVLFAEIAERIQGVATYPGDVVADEIFGSALTQILEEGRDVQGALDEAQRLVERRARR